MTTRLSDEEFEAVFTGRADVPEIRYAQLLEEARRARESEAEALDALVKAQAFIGDQYWPDDTTAKRAAIVTDEIFVVLSKAGRR